jgi:hypothetical protein|tara:strand:- start:4915 stop:5400 length:486 start_codon:yes stop_codon:yes gene_type:complete
MTLRSQFIAVVSDREKETRGVVKSTDVLKYSLNNEIWCLYKGTQLNNHVKPGSRLVFYCGGRTKLMKGFYASATVSKLSVNVSSSDLARMNDLDLWYYNIPSTKLELVDIKLFNKPVDINSVLDKVSIFKSKKNKWWYQLQGGLCSISPSDYKNILKMTSS